MRSPAWLRMSLKSGLLPDTWCLSQVMVLRDVCLSQEEPRPTLRCARLAREIFRNPYARAEDRHGEWRWRRTGRDLEGMGASCQCQTPVTYTANLRTFIKDSRLRLSPPFYR